MTTRRALAAAALALFSLALPASVRAHEMPNDVTVRMFVRAEGKRATLVVRVPLAAIAEVQIPTGRGGVLDLANAALPLREAVEGFVDLITISEDGRPLGEPKTVAVRPSLPSEAVFGSYESALAHATGPQPPGDTELAWQEWLVDAVFEYPLASETSRLAIRPSFMSLGKRVLTVLRFRTQKGAERAFELSGDPGTVELDPSWTSAALRFVRLGFRHILDGTDHLLFLLCLVIPFRRFRPLVLVVTSFTVAHSITLIASAFDLAPRAAWFPPLIETLIAISIVYMAIENIVAPQLKRRWIITFAFGLVHGFGFSFALKETLQFAGAHLLTSLLSFNVGVELGQLLVLIALLPLLELLFRALVPERLGTILLSAFVAHTGWHWMLERVELLRPFLGR